MPEDPPGVFRNVADQTASSGQTGLPVKTDWKDFVALTLAVYQILLGPLLLVIGGLVGVYLLFWWLAR